jgi:hypothetical protein
MSVFSKDTAGFFVVVTVLGAATAMMVAKAMFRGMLKHLHKIGVDISNS